MTAKKKPRALPVLLREAWKIRDEIDAAAVRLAGQAVRRGPKNVRKAVETITEMLYFRETHKWEGMVNCLLRDLAPDVYRVYEERGALAAYNAAHPEDA